MQPVVLEKRERGLLMRTLWRPYLFYLAEGDAALCWAPPGSGAGGKECKESGRIPLDGSTACRALPRDDGGAGRPFLVEVAEAARGLVHVLSCPDEAATRALLASLLAAVARRRAGAGRGDADGAGLGVEAAEVLLQVLGEGDVDDLSSGAGADDAPYSALWEAGSSFARGLAGSAAELAGALVPGLLEVARDVPFLGPVAGLLLKCHQAYSSLTENRERLDGLAEALALAGTLMVQVSRSLALLEDSEDVVTAMKRLALAAHAATVVVSKLQARQARRLAGAVLGAVLSGRDRTAIHGALSGLQAAAEGFHVTLAAATGISTLGRLDRMEKQLGGVAEELHHASEVNGQVRNSLCAVAALRHETHIVDSFSLFPPLPPIPCFLS